jgi:hypothetical protein
LEGTPSSYTPTTQENITQEEIAHSETHRQVSLWQKEEIAQEITKEFVDGEDPLCQAEDPRNTGQENQDFSRSENGINTKENGTNHARTHRDTDTSDTGGFGQTLGNLILFTLLATSTPKVKHRCPQHCVVFN